jgi:hypothetical protein
MKKIKSLLSWLKKERKLKQDRIKVRQLGFKIYKRLWIAKFMARRLSRQVLQVHWVIKQEEGYMVINTDSMQRLNKVKEAVAKIKRMPFCDKFRERDLNRSAIYKTLPINGSVLKICS